jgi:hypothetical protein
MPLITAIIGDIKTEVLKNDFAIEEEEIYFFKHIKPTFYALLFYELFLLDLDTRRPIGTPQIIKAYYEDELGHIARFFEINAFYYHYYKTGATELDDRYFIRDAAPGRIPVMDLIDPFPGFSTTLDLTFARFIAYEQLQRHIVDRLTQPPLPLKKMITLKWTGEAINLVEVAYGIWLTGQLNNGNATITEIIQFLEQHLGIGIGIPNARWAQLSARKTTAPTKYLDRMKEALEQRMAEELDKRKLHHKARRKN